MRTLFFLRRVGPYHHARFEAVQGDGLIVIETRPDSQEYEWKFKADGGYVIEKFPTATNPELGINGSQLKEVIHALFSKHQPQVVVTTGWADHEYHAVVLEATKRNIPKIVISDSRYDDEPRRFYKEWIKRMLLRTYEAALVAGTASRNYLLQLGYNGRNIFYPWDVVDNTYFNKSEAQSIDFSHREFICVSRFISKKNLEGLVDAFKEYKKNGGNRNLTLLGSGELETSLRAQVREYGLEQNIFFKGFVQYDVLPAYLNRSFFLILPSWSDQWGLVVNEAMAAGLPVIVSARCGCAADLVKNQVNGYTFDPLIQHELIEKMRAADLLKEKEWVIMGNNARQEMEKWGLEDFAQALLKACIYAIQHPAKNSFKLLHRFLSR